MFKKKMVGGEIEDYSDAGEYGDPETVSGFALNFDADGNVLFWTDAEGEEGWITGDEMFGSLETAQDVLASYNEMLSMAEAGEETGTTIAEWRYEIAAVTAYLDSIA